eukprot:2654769-Pyramimonas_sp.AAC.1
MEGLAAHALSLREEAFSFDRRGDIRWLRVRRGRRHRARRAQPRWQRCSCAAPQPHRRVTRRDVQPEGPVGVRHGQL